MRQSKRYTLVVLTLLILALCRSTGAEAGAPDGLDNPPVPNETGSKETASVPDNFVDASGTKLHYVRAGAGQTLVMLHGNDGTLEDFKMSLFNRLSKKYDAIAFDRPGHGASETPKNEIPTPEVQARLLHAALVKLNVKKPLLLAHSWSSSIALSYALQFPDDVSGIVLLGGVAFSTKEDQPRAIYHLAQIPILGNLLALAYKLNGKHEVESALNDAFSPEEPPKSYVKKFMANMFRTSQLKAAAQDELTLNPCLDRMSSDYAKIQRPLVIVCGNKDKSVPHELHSIPLHKAVPNSQLIVLENAGHELQFTRPDDVIKALNLAERMDYQKTF